MYVVLVEGDRGARLRPQPLRDAVGGGSRGSRGEGYFTLVRKQLGELGRTIIDSRGHVDGG